MNASGPYLRFLVLSSPRCGSHMLRRSLCSHPNIVCLTEMFNPDLTNNEPFDACATDTELLNERIFRKYPDRVRAVGFLLHRSGARIAHRPGELWRKLMLDRELRVISLRRENLLRRYISYELMRQKRTNRRTSSVFSPEELKTEFELREAELTWFDQRFSHHQMLPVSYEEMCASYNETMARIQTFLDVPVQKLQTDTAPNLRLPLEQAIENYREVFEAFRDTRWAGFFGPETNGTG